MNDTASCENALADFFYPDLLANEDLGSHLAHVEASLRSMACAMIEANLERMDDELHDQVPPGWTVLEKPGRTLITLCGAVAYKRRVYSDGFGCRRYLLDEVLGIPDHSHFEPQAFLWVVRRAAEVSYEKAAREFLDRTGVPISRTTVMRCVHKEGELLAAAETHGRGLPLSAEVLFCEFDGFWVHLQSPTKRPEALPRRTYKEQFKGKSCEMKVFVAYCGKDGRGRRAVPVHWASDAAPEAFFAECIGKTREVYDVDDARFVATNSDGAGWCKGNGIAEEVLAQIANKLDVFHVNQRVYRAFPDEGDRSFYLGLLYGRDFDSFFAALDERMGKEPGDERANARKDLRGYVSNNLDWLQGMSLTALIRKSVRDDLPAVFGDRPFLGYLDDLLEHRRYKRFLAALEKIARHCDGRLRYDYENYLADARHAVGLIDRARRVHMGTMEGTNAKVYAARLKVWGCSWSRRGAIAMMRIRATIHSGGRLLAPAYDAWFTKQEQRKRELADVAARTFSFNAPLSEGEGYEPPRATLALQGRLPPKVYGLLRC